MSWAWAKDIVLIGNGLFLAGLYLAREPYFLYPTFSVSLTVVWEALGWDGSRSALALLIVLGSVLLVAAIRRLRHQPIILRDSRERSRAVAFTIVGFAFWTILVGIPLTLIHSA